MIAILCGGLALFAPTLSLGLMADDYFAVAVTSGTFAAERGALDAFNFARGDADDLSQVQRLGSLPWWAPSDFKLAFLRPLSGALWHVDRALFGERIVLYHVHSLAVWGVLVLVAGALYRKLLGPLMAGFAAAVFLLDQSLHAPVFWLANRGALYATLLGLSALGLHIAWQERRDARFAWLSALATLLALLFGEWALPVLAYVVAFELVGNGDRWRQRALRLLPATTLTLAYVGARALLGYGARGSGMYVDPTAEPLRYLVLLTHRVPVLIADMLANLPASWWDHGTPWHDAILELELIPPRIWMQLPSWPTFHVAIGVGACLTAAWLLRACFRGLSPSERSTARWLLLGALLALLPVAGSFASTRLTLAAMFGVAALLGLFVRHLGRELWAHAAAGAPVGFALRWARGCFVVHAQLLTPLRTDLNREVEFLTSARQWVLSAELDDRKLPRQRVLLLSSSEFISTFFWAYTWHHHGHALPRSYYPLSAATMAHDVERTADNALVLRPLGRSLLLTPSGLMFRAPERTLVPGHQIALPGMRVERAHPSDPRSVRFTFDVALDDPSLVFLTSTPEGLTRFELPAVGQTVRIPAPAQPSFAGLAFARELARIGPLPTALRYAPLPWFVDYEPR